MAPSSSSSSSPSNSHSHPPSPSNMDFNEYVFAMEDKNFKHFHNNREDKIIEHNGVQFYQSIQDSSSDSPIYSNKFESPNSFYRANSPKKSSSVEDRRFSEVNFKVPLRPFRNHSIVSNVPPVQPSYIPPPPNLNTLNIDGIECQEVNENSFRSQSSQASSIQDGHHEGVKVKRKSGWLNFFTSSSPPKTISNCPINSSIDDFDIICPLETGISENQLPSEDDPHIVEMRNKFTQYDISSTSSLFPENDFSWKTPESWVVLGPDAYNSPTQSIISTSPPSENNNLHKRQIDCLRVYKPQGGPNSLFSPQISSSISNASSPITSSKSSSKKYLKSVTVPITANTTAAELCQKLAFKWSSNSIQQNELTRYRLYIHHHRTQRLLEHDEKPAQLLADHLLTLGYTELDDLSEIARDDHSYFCKFIYREYPPLPPLSQNFVKDPSDPNKAWIDDKTAHLADADLSAIPSILFKKSYTLETMDLTRNNLLTLPMDLLEIMPRLRTLILKGMLLDSLPPSLKLLGASLTHLDLGSNLFCSSSDLTVLSHFSLLTHLDLSCNLLEDLIIGSPSPSSHFVLSKDEDNNSSDDFLLQPLSTLRFLNLSSNSFTKIPEIIWKMKDLRDFDISFNKLTLIPSLIGSSFPLIRTLSLVGNQIMDVEGSPFPIENLGNLWHFDIRGNLLNSSSFLSSLLTLPQLRELHVDYNLFGSMDDSLNHASNICDTVSKVSSSNLNKITCICNSLTGISFGVKFLSLRELDLSQSKLFTLPSNLFDSTPLLTELNLNQNELVRLPPSLSSLRYLTILTADLNSLDSVELSFEKMESLRYLSLHSNNILTVSGDIWLSKCLEYLNLTSNFIPQFPPSPLAPKGGEPLSLSLKEFLIADNRLDNEISSTLVLLKRLKLVNLSFNCKILSLTPDFMLGSHLSIEEIYLSSIGLTAFPEGLLVPQMESSIGFPNLKSIYINNNRIVQLPNYISEFTSLMVIDAQCNKLNYNITNLDWDWNWQSQKDTLKSLNLSNNPQLIIRQSQLTSPNSLSNSLLFGASIPSDKKTVTDFTQMKQLRSLDVRNVKVEKGSFPIGFSDLNIRSNVDEGRVSISEYTGRANSTSMIFDKSELVNYNFMDDELVIALFDGHGNEFISSYLADIFIDCLRLELREDEGPSEALRRSFLSANRKLFSQPVMKQQQENILKRKRKSSSPSSFNIEEQYSASASLIYIFDGHLIAANVGDCMALLCREGMAVPLTQRHHAFSLQEQNRIRKMGGSINLHGLVEGETRLTRGFGLHHLLPWITADPWITGDIELGNTDEFLLLASQSFWSVFVGYQTAVDLARKFIRENTSIPSNSRKLSFDLSVESLRDMAISRGAQYSMKIILVDLENIGNSLRPGKLKGAPSLEHPAITNRKNRTQNSYSPSAVVKRSDSMDNKLMINLEAEVQAPIAPCAFVFTDIKNSSELWSLVPNAMHVATKHHNQLIRRLLRIHHGYELKTNGDNFVIAFGDSVSAVRFCVAVQRDFLLQDWPNEIINQKSFSPVYGSDQRLLYRGISLRMGIHFGDASREMDIVSRRMDYMGPSVIIAQRVEGCADGGQINITRPVREHLMQQDNAPNKPDVVIHDLGMIQLKGIPERQLLFALYPSGLSERRHILSDGSLIKPDIPLINDHPTIDTIIDDLSNNSQSINQC